MEEAAYADGVGASGGELEVNEKTGFACGVKLGCTADVTRKKIDTLSKEHKKIF
jgi:hypothetical protein